MSVDEMRDRIAAYLLKHRVCIISTSGAMGAWAMPARYRSRGLEVECLLPRWADVAYYLEQDPQVLLIVLDPQAEGVRWLQYLGTAQPVAAPDWAGLLPERTFNLRPEDLYLVVRVTPRRIDLVDESRGWGVRETLDL